MPIEPLPIDAAIVDSTGRPTPLFIQKWNKLRNAIAALEGLGGVSEKYDTGTHTLKITIENGRVTAVEETPIPP